MLALGLAIVQKTLVVQQGAVGTLVPLFAPRVAVLVVCAGLFGGSLVENFLYHSSWLRTKIGTLSMDLTYHATTGGVIAKTCVMEIGQGAGVVSDGVLVPR